MFKSTILGSVCCYILLAVPTHAKTSSSTSSVVKQKKYIEKSGLNSVPNIAVVQLIQDNNSNNTKTSAPKTNTPAATLASDQIATYNSYLSALRARIQKIWIPPAKIGNQKTSVIVTIKHDGTLDDTDYGTMNKDALFNARAIDAINSSAPFDPLPTEDNELVVRITFDKNLVAPGKPSNAGKPSDANKPSDKTTNTDLDGLRPPTNRSPQPQR